MFAGAGGAAFGYYLAGFRVVGVDIKPQPHYPFEFIEMDALSILRSWSWGTVIRPGSDRDWLNAPRIGVGHFAAIHASPPCQRYIRGGLSHHDKHPDLIGPVRELLEHERLRGIPYVIENVPGSPLRVDLQICGSMFDLPIRRHRWFEANFPLPAMTLACDHSRKIAGVYGNLHGLAGAWRGMLPDTLETRSEALGIDWMDANELALAIPPAYTELIGLQLRKHLDNATRRSDNDLQGAGL